MLSCKLTEEAGMEIAQTDEHCFTTRDFFFLHCRAHRQYDLGIVSPGYVKNIWLNGWCFVYSGMLDDLDLMSFVQIIDIYLT